MTKNGKVLIDIIGDVTCHPTAEEVYRIVYDKGYSMSLATVYNNLNSLSEEGSIRKISIPNQPDRYDKLDPHDHLICTKCGCINDIFLKSKKQELETEIGRAIDSYDLQLFHVCANCNQENNCSKDGEGSSCHGHS